MKSKKEKILILRFNNTLYQNELPYFRGAINELLKDKNDVLFHNHEGDSFRYSYPLIQYKRINNKAAMVCLQKGTEAVGLLLLQPELNCKLGTKDYVLEIESVKASNFTIQTWESNFSYRLRKWLPLNQENYIEYQKLEGIAEKSLFFERILIGNILSFAKGLDIRFENEVICKIISIDEPHLITYKNVKLMSFDIEFKSNVSIPDYIGLGKGASLGFGMITRKNEQEKTQNI